MLDFADLPYQFVPPKPNAFIIALARLINRRFVLPGKNHKISSIELSGTDAFAEAKRKKGARFVLLPNHPAHSDPHVINEVCRRIGVKPAFMAAYDVFARDKFAAWVMQHLGSFSIDREGSDRTSMKCAAEILEAGKYPLVLFPEGNVYLCNDRITPYNQGAAYVSLRAQKVIGDDAPVFVVPIATKYTYVENVRGTIRAVLDDIATKFDTAVDPAEPITEELKRISITALARYLKQRGHIPPADANSPADEQIAHAAVQVIESLESKMELRPRPADGLTDRVRKIRAAVHGIRTDPAREIDHRAATSWADEAILALRILGYEGAYAAENPSLDRVTETIARLYEDVTSKSHPAYGKRHALVEIGTPIDLRDHLEAFKSKARPAIAAVTAACETAAQEGIDRLNDENDRLGAQPF